MLAGRNGIAENLWERMQRMPQNIRADWAKQVAPAGLPQRRKLHKPFFPTIQDQQDGKKTTASSAKWSELQRDSICLWRSVQTLAAFFTIPSHYHHYPILSLWIN